MCQYVSQPEGQCSQTMKQTTKETFNNNMHHHENNENNFQSFFKQLRVFYAQASLLYFVKIKSEESLSSYVFS